MKHVRDMRAFTPYYAQCRHTDRQTGRQTENLTWQNRQHRKATYHVCSAGASHKPRPCAKKDYDADLSHLQADCRASNDGDARACAGIGWRPVPVHLAQGSNPACSNCQAHGLQVNHTHLHKHTTARELSSSPCYRLKECRRSIILI